jgi:PAS domain S-box-containing protein
VLASRSGIDPITRPLNPDCTLDVNGRLIHCNEDLVRALGSGKDELMGQPFSHLLTDESGQALNRAFDHLVGAGAAQTELQLKMKDGATIYADARLTALYDSQGHFTMIRCALQVIPTLLLLQQRHEENERLRRALHNLHEEVSLLASIISHDLRQPLHATLALCEFLEMEYISHLDAQAQWYLQSIEQANMTMKELIEDVVRYARLLSASGAYEEVNLGQLVEEVREELSATLAERGATLQIVGQWPVVTCDRERVKELLTELMTNAIKFNDKPQPVIETGMMNEAPEGYTFYVKDDGIGIESSYHESIFRLFYRLHKPEEYSGTGAGLAVCRRIVELHGGRIWVQSQLGAGATFFFTLPRDMPPI